MKGWQALSGEYCGNCKYFCQHYMRTGRGRYYPLWCGHCNHPKLKQRRVEEHCPHWTAKEPES